MTDETEEARINGMSDTPRLEPPSSSEGKLRFARFAGIFSLIAPFAAVVCFVLLFALMRFSGGTRVAAAALLSLFPLLLLVAGIGLGIAAVAIPKRHERPGTFLKGLIGVCANFLLIAAVFVVPFLIARSSLKNYPVTPEARLKKATDTIASAPSEAEKFYALDAAAKESFIAGKIEPARQYAAELLTLAPKYRSDWNYGNAIQDGNIVLGRIALQEGNTNEAKKYLIEAGKSPGSPQMNSFGPNMSLALDLIKAGDRDTPLQYFELCRKFWKMDRGQLDDWRDEVKAGKVPNFGANLVF